MNKKQPLPPEHQELIAGRVQTSIRNELRWMFGTTWAVGLALFGLAFAQLSSLSDRIDRLMEHPAFLRPYVISLGFSSAQPLVIDDDVGVDASQDTSASRTDYLDIVGSGLGTLPGRVEIVDDGGTVTSLVGDAISHWDDTTITVRLPDGALADWSNLTAADIRVITADGRLTPRSAGPR